MHESCRQKGFLPNFLPKVREIQALTAQGSVSRLSDVVVKKHYQFLAVAVLDNIWRRFDLNRFFSDLPYAEAMAVNRCLDPKTKIHIKEWTEATVLPRLQKVEFPELI